MSLSDSSRDSQSDTDFSETEGIAWKADFYKSESDSDSNEEQEGLRLQKQQTLSDNFYFNEIKVKPKTKAVVAEKLKYKNDLMGNVILMNQIFKSTCTPILVKVVERRINELKDIQKSGILLQSSEGTEEDYSSEENAAVNEEQQESSEAPPPTRKMEVLVDSDEEFYNNQVVLKLKKKKPKQISSDEKVNDYILDQVSEEDKRLATFKILNNRGLTPYRKKENRNPRVKRKNRYNAALKKLSSTKRIVIDKSKVGEYSGESTGIKVGLTRSLKF